MKKALITGITGQDGSYLAELLLEKGYEVHGLVTKLPIIENLSRFFRIQNILPKIILHEGDITNEPRISDLIHELLPDEIYDLAAIVDPLVSHDTERKILWNNISGIHNLLGAINAHSPTTKLFFASSSLVFGSPDVSPQDESTAKRPITPYGIAKSAGCGLVEMYRKSYGIFACYGILYNHESTRRDLKFLPRKITEGAARISAGLQEKLSLGDIDAVRDWGFAGDYVEAMWLMLQQDIPDDYVIGTGKQHTVRELLEIAFKTLGLEWQKYVIVDKIFMRQREKYPLIANNAKAQIQLGWCPKIDFEELIAGMVKEDIKKII